MIIGRISLDPKICMLAEYRWPRLILTLIVGGVLMKISMWCMGYNARKYLAMLNPHIHEGAAASAIGEIEVDSDGENENARDDLGIEVEKIGFHPPGGR
jgi:hypothetical protein